MADLRQRWRRWRGLRPDEAAFVLRAAAVLGLLRVALAVGSLRHVEGLLGRAVGRAPPTHAPATDPVHLARLLHLAARGAPWHANCLQRSLALRWFLERRGVASDLVIGVSPAADAGTPAFHAWLELDGQVLNDAPDVRARFRVLERPAGSGPAGRRSAASA